MLKIYKEDFTVRSYQTDLNARMKPSAILEVMQEAAGQHSERLGLGRSALLAKNTAWVLTRVEVDMDRYPAFEETFSVETFPMPVRRCFFPRYFGSACRRDRGVRHAANRNAPAALHRFGFQRPRQQHALSGLVLRRAGD